MTEENGRTEEEKGEYGCPACGAELEVNVDKEAYGRAIVCKNTGTYEIDVIYAEIDHFLHCSACNWHADDMWNTPDRYRSELRKLRKVVDKEMAED